LSLFAVLKGSDALSDNLTSLEGIFLYPRCSFETVQGFVDGGSNFFWAAFSFYLTFCAPGAYLNSKASYFCSAITS
jgi:hypothetical protein